MDIRARFMEFQQASRSEQDRILAAAKARVSVAGAYIDPADCSCSGSDPCLRCGAHIGCECHRHD